MPKNKNPQTKPIKILYIGDSHSAMTMGKSLLKVWGQRSPESFDHLCYYAVSGSTFRDWQTGSLQHLTIKNLKKEPFSSVQENSGAFFVSLEKLLESHSPELVIIALGTNDLLKFQMGFEDYLQEVRKELLNRHQSFGVSFLWVMPPTLPKNLDPEQKRSKLLSALKDLSCVQVVNIDSILPDQEDGYHFHKERGLEFSQALIHELINKNIF